MLACDGLWDVMTSQQVCFPQTFSTLTLIRLTFQVVNFTRRKLREHGDVQKAAEQLVKKALDLSSVDNVSAFVVAFHQPQQPLRLAGAESN